MTVKGFKTKLLETHNGRAQAAIVFESFTLTPALSRQREREQEARRAKQRPDETKAERSDGPYGLPLPSGRAEKRRAWGGRGRAACRASCSDSLRLSERSAQARSEFRSAAPRPSIAGCPEAKRRGHGQWGRLFLWLLFFWRDKKKVTAPPGAHPGQQRIQPQQQLTPQTTPQTPRSPPPAPAPTQSARPRPRWETPHSPSDAER